jgi:hypothetical protein
VAALAAFVLAAVLGVGAYAFTASNTVKPVHAGLGDETISGYEVKEQEFIFGTEGRDIKAVKFKLSAPASAVDAAVLDAAGNPTTAEYEGNKCVEAGNDEEWLCTLENEVANESANQRLYVLAVEHGAVTIE